MRQDSDYLFYTEWKNARELSPSYKDDLYWHAWILKRAKGKILDIGAGHDPNKLRMITNKKNYYILDTSKKVINQLAKENYYAIRGSHQKIPFPNQTFDTIISSYVLEHTPYWQQSIDEAQKKLKPGGTIFIAVPINPKYWTIRDEQAGHIQRFIPWKLFEYLTLKGWIIDDIKYTKTFFLKHYKKYVLKHAADRKTALKQSKNPLTQLILRIITPILLLDRYLWMIRGMNMIIRAQKPIKEDFEG